MTKFIKIINILMLILLLVYIGIIYLMLASTIRDLNEANKALDAFDDEVKAYTQELNVLESQIEDLQKEVDTIIIKSEGIE